MRHVVAVRLRMHAVAQVAGREAGLQHQRDIEHGHVDALALTGALPLEQSRGQSVGAHCAGRVIDGGGADFDGRGVRCAGAGHDAGCGLDDVVVGGAFALRAALTEGGEGRVDQFRIYLAQVFVAEAELFEGAGTVVFDQHIGRGDEFLQDFAALLGFQVQRDRPLVGALGEEAGAHQRVVEVVVGAGIAALIRVGGILDLDDIGAHQAELIGGEGAGEDVGDVDNADAFERARHGGFLLLVCWTEGAVGARGRQCAGAPSASRRATHRPNSGHSRRMVGRPICWATNIGATGLS